MRAKRVRGARQWCRAAVPMAVMGLAAVTHAQPDPAAPTTTGAAAATTPARYSLPSTHAWDLASEGGELYRIFVSYPAVDAPAGGFPVLYVLDGNSVFATFAETRRVQERNDVGKSIIVGVGYPGDDLFHVRRLNDFTPPMIDPPPAHLRRLAQFRSGGRDEFLDFLTGRLRSEIQRRYAVDPARQSLFGYSLGGLFALHALYTAPAAFHSIVAASPSLEWNEQGVLPEEREFVRKLTRGEVGKTSRLLVIVGARDVDDDPLVAEAMVRRLDPLSGHGLRTRLLRYEDEAHLSVPARAVTDTLRYVFEAR